MLLTRAFFDAGLVCGTTLALAAALLTILTVPRPFRLQPLNLDDTVLLAMLTGGAGLVGLLGSQDVMGAVLWSSLSLVLGVLLLAWLPRLTVAGVLQLTAPVVMLAAALPWSYMLLGGHGAPEWLCVLIIVSGLVSAPLLALTTATRLAREAVLSHRDWRRPTQAREPAADARCSKVSVHLPAYAEPPEVVIAVLNRLARLDYPSFEVLVCDNNTADEALWRPLERHCARLNRACGLERFRFFHVAPLPGAKAGALNFCLDHTAPDAELVAVIDADYLAEPDFLRRLAPFFSDPTIAYVQTPHDYRGWAGNPYLTACYWEYMPSNKIELPGVNEYGAAYTIGTMCLLRRDALERAGRWAEWCLTEDSEVSVRLRALGYEGVYIDETFGRGLIPETFEDYKKQRFRWTAGPVQQLRRHWRLYLPVRLGGSPHIRPWSKMLEASRGAAPLVQPIGMAASLTGLVTALLLIAGGTEPALTLPPAAWLAMLIGSAATLMTTWYRYRLAGCNRLADMAMGEVARLSLSWVQATAAIAGLSTRPLAWRRTPKFAAVQSASTAWRAAAPECGLGVAHMVFAVVLACLSEALGGAFGLLLAAGALASGARFLSAPLMAWLSERQLARAAQSRARSETMRELFSR